MRMISVAVTSLSGVALGCSSINPIPADVTRLSAYQIVHKIRCEAQETVRALYRDEGLAKDQDGFDALTKNIGDIEQKIKKLGPQKDELDQERTRLDYMKKFRARQNQNARADAEIFIRLPRDQQTEEELDRIIAERKKQKIAHWRLAKEISNFLHKLDRYQFKLMFLNKKKAVHEKQRESSHKKLVRFRGHAIAYAFQNEIKQSNAAALDASFLFPIPNGTFTIGGNAADAKDRTGIRKIHLAATFSKLLERDCKDAVGLEHDQTVLPKLYPIKGRVGLDEVIKQYWQVQSNAKFDKGKETYFSSIEFSTTVSGSLSPQFTIVPSTGKKVTSGSGSKFSTSRKDEHKVIVALTPPGTGKASDDDAIVRVQIIGDTDSLLR